MIDETYLFNEEKLPLKDHRFFFATFGYFSEI